MARNQSIISLLVQVMGAKSSANKLKKLEKTLNRMGAAGKLASKPFAALGAGLRFGKTAMGAFGKAMRNTLAYGAMRVFTNAFRTVIRDLKEAGTLSLSLARTSAILSQGFRKGSTGAKSYQNSYDGLIDTMTRGKKTSYMTMRELTDVGFVTAIAGLRGDKYTKTLEMMDKMSAVTGESAKTLSADFIRVMNAFGIGAEEFEKGGDILVGGITNAVMMMPDLLNAVKMLGPTWRLAFGEGTEQLKEFTAAMGALANLGLKGGQGARYLNRMIMGLLAPTSEVASAMREFGFNIYDTSEGGAAAASAMDELTRSISEQKRELDELYQERSQLIVAGQNMVKVDNKIAKGEEKIAKWSKRIQEEHKEIVRGGGKLQKFSTIVEQIHRAASGAGQMEVAELFKKMFQLRGTRGALAIIAQFEDFLRLMKKIEQSEGTLGKMFGEMGQTWGVSLHLLVSGLSKVKMILAETFAGPWLKTIAEGIQTHVVEPFLDSFGGWKKLRDKIGKLAEGMFTPWIKEVGKLVSMVMNEAPKSDIKVQIGKVIDPILSPIKKFFGGIFDSLATKLEEKLQGINWMNMGMKFGEGIFYGIQQAVTTGKKAGQAARKAKEDIEKKREKRVADIKQLKEWGMDPLMEKYLNDPSLITRDEPDRDPNLAYHKGQVIGKRGSSLHNIMQAENMTNMIEGRGKGNSAPWWADDSAGPMNMYDMFRKYVDTSRFPGTPSDPYKMSGYVPPHSSTFPNDGGKVDPSSIPGGPLTDFSNALNEDTGAVISATEALKNNNKAMKGIRDVDNTPKPGEDD